MQTSELTIIEQPELLQVAKQSKIDLTKAESYVAGYAPFMVQISDLSQELKNIDKANPSAENAATARRKRLDLVKVRTAAVTKKDADKEIILVETRLIDGLFKVVENTSKLTESEYMEIEKHQERIENERLLKLESERKELLSPYGSLNQFVDLKLMDEETFNGYLSKEKLAFEAKIEADAKAEKQRIADEKKAAAEQKAKDKADALERERIRKENERLKAESELKDKRFAEMQPMAIMIRDFNGMLAMDEASYQKELSEIKIGYQQHLDYQFEKQKEENAQKAELERVKAENERIAKELQAKKDQEEKEYEAEKLRIQNESSERIAKEKAATLAPEREKVKSFFTEFDKLKFPELTSEQGIAMTVRVNEALLIVRKLIISDSKNLL